MVSLASALASPLHVKVLDQPTFMLISLQPLVYAIKADNSWWYLLRVMALLDIKITLTFLYQSTYMIISQQPRLIFDNTFI